MPERRLFPEFRDQYELTKFPFTDVSTLASIDGQVIDRDLFLDASLYPIGAVGYLYISEIIVEPRRVRIAVADQTRAEKASVEFDPLFAPTILKLVDQFARPAGILVSESVRLARFTSWQVATHRFTAASTTFVPSCVIPTPEVGVRGIMTEAGDLFIGDFIILGENGVVVREEAGEPGCIRVDIVGDPLSRRKLCTPIALFTTPRFVKTINGCPPDPYGNFNLTVGNELSEDTILRIYPTAEGLVVAAVGTNVQGPNI